MIWSVSTLLRRSGTPTPVCWVNFSMMFFLFFRSDRLEVGQRAAVGRGGARRQVGVGRERAADRGRRRDERRDEVRATALALAALEVAVRRGRRALAGRELVGVHAEAHRAAGVAPLGAEVEEDLVEPLGLGLEPHAGGRRDDEDAHPVGLLLALDDLGD